MTLRELLDRFHQEMDRAGKAGVAEPTAAALATASGRPSVRMVLLKGADERGFVVYTNLESRKGREVATTAWAALCFWWPPTATQIRVEGRVELVGSADADAYYASRERTKQVSAWASRQSDAIESREVLIAQAREVETKYEGKPIPRPAYWTGMRIVPDRFEFWYGHEDRLHERFEYRLERGVWVSRILSP